MPTPQGVISTRLSPDIEDRLIEIAQRQDRSVASVARYLIRLGVAVLDGDFVTAQGLSEGRREAILRDGILDPHQTGQLAGVP